MTDSMDGSPASAIPWEVRLVDAIPLPPFVAGLSISLVLIGLVVLVGGQDASPSNVTVAGLSSELRSTILVGLLVGYTMAAGRYLPMAIARDLQHAGRIDPSIDPEREYRRVLELKVDDLGRSRIAGATGIALWLLIYGATSATSAGPLFFVDPLTGWLLMPLLCWLLARAAFHTSLGARGTSRDSWMVRPLSVDILDLRPCYVEGRIGLRLAGVWIAGTSIFALLYFDRAMHASVLPFLIGGGGVAVLALTLPVRRIHHEIRAAKRAELTRTEPELRRAREHVLHGESGREGRLADLLTYRSYVESLREWPFDNSTMARFVLYLLIPVGSWVGGALMERALANILD